MTDAQQLIDFARRNINELADDVERHFNHVAGKLRENFARTPPPPPVRRAPPPTTLQLVGRWLARHQRALTWAGFMLLGGGGLTAYYLIDTETLLGTRKKRRARKSASGARMEVVVVAGAVANPLTSALYLDLERKGYVVYVVSNTMEDEHFIRSQSRADLHPLALDLVDQYTAQEQLARFRNLFEREHVAFEGTEPYTLNFKGLVLVPDIQAPPAAIEMISSEEWSDALNAKVLNPIATTQLLLPAVIENNARVLLMTPSVTPSLRPAMHATESTVHGALTGFTSSLAAELRQADIGFSHIKLGNIDIPAVTAKHRREGAAAPRLRPTPLRVLHNSVFDALESRRPRGTLYVGRGSLAYDIIGRVAPSSLIAWMTSGIRRRAATEEIRDDDLQHSSASLTWEKVEQEA